MNDNQRRSQTDDWAQSATAAIPRIDYDAATMARPATPALAWSQESSREPAAPEYAAIRTKRMPRAMTFAGIGVGAAAAIATAAIAVSGGQSSPTQVAAPNTATQSVVSAPTTPPVAPTQTVAPVSQARRSQSGNTTSASHQSPPAATYSPSNGQQDGYQWQQQQWQPPRDVTPRDFRWFLPHFDGTNNGSYDHDWSRDRDQSGRHHSDSSHDDNH